MDAALWAEARRLVLVEKMSKQAAARALRVDPKTVRRALRMDRFVETAPPPPRPKRIDPFRPRVEELLAAHPTLSAVRVREEIAREGFRGDVTTVRDLVREIRGRMPRAAFLKLSFAPGDAAQVDWAACGTVRVGEAVRRLSCFVMVLCWSRALYLEFTLSEKIETFLECHENAFRFFEGVPRRAIYDNLKSVVLERTGRDIRWNPRFREFAGHYLLEPVACNPASGWEKGRVERAILYIRESFLEGREVDGADIDSLNGAAARWRDEVANLRVHRETHRRPADLLAEERPVLRPLPSRPAETETIVAVRADAQFRVCFDGNRYSVPARLAHASLTLRASARRVRLFDLDALVAEHERSYARGVDVLTPSHAQSLLRKKRRGERDELLRRFLALGEEAASYWKALAKSVAAPARHIARIVRLIDRFGEEEVLSSLRRASTLDALGASYVENLIEQERRRRGRPEILPLVITKARDLESIEVPAPDLAIYDRVLSGERAVDRPIAPSTDEGDADSDLTSGDPE